VNLVVAVAAVGGLGMLAAAGVVAGLTRRDPAPLEPPDDPLADGRLALVRSLADLEDAHAAGALDGVEYVRLREATDARMARILRALERREQAPDQVRVASRSTTAEETSADVRRVPPWAVGTLIGGVVLALIVAALVRDAEPTSDAASTPPVTADDPLAFFERRVQQQPDDLAARLDLAHRYLDARMIDEALVEYAVALELDPDDAEALAHVGYILYIGERPEEALASVDRALETDPAYPEALFFRGVILLDGLDRPHEAIDAFEAYLDAAPFGVQRGQARELIEQARNAAAST
jgi:cytochrome c-type biogenesis protein CcmH/NrfG